MDDGVTNLFVHQSAARRYAAARPYFHPQVIAKIAAFTGMSRVGTALDVACGTGQSARALAAIADVVEAIDVSQAMIAEAEPLDRVHYQVASAEAIPFGLETFDLVTVGLAFHWFNQASFLREANRVLRSSGWLVVYTSGLNGEMAEQPSFREWAWGTYPGRFPAPARRSTPLTPELATAHGFVLRGSEFFSHDETMSAEEITDYLLTQTNVIASVESGHTPIAQATEWIAAGIAPFFGGLRRTMKFGGTIWYLQKVSTDETTCIE